MCVHLGNDNESNAWSAIVWLAIRAAENLRLQTIVLEGTFSHIFNFSIPRFICSFPRLIATPLFHTAWTIACVQR